MYEHKTKPGASASRPLLSGTQDLKTRQHPITGNPPVRSDAEQKRENVSRPERTVQSLRCHHICGAVTFFFFLNPFLSFSTPLGAVNPSAGGADECRERRRWLIPPPKPWTDLTTFPPFTSFHRWTLFAGHWESLSSLVSVFLFLLFFFFFLHFKRNRRDVFITAVDHLC